MNIKDIIELGKMGYKKDDITKLTEDEKIIDDDFMTEINTKINSLSEQIENLKLKKTQETVTDAEDTTATVADNLEKILKGE